MKTWIKRIALGLLLLLLAITAGFVWWGLHPLEAMPEALNALQSDDQVRVEEDPWMTFAPAGTNPTVGVIIYPGGHVDARAYAPLTREIAKAGYFVVLPSMPLNLAVLNSKEATQIIAAYPEIESWIIGGHSLGGAMAAEYVKAQPDKIAGLILWASYSAESTNLSAIPALKVISIYGTEDGGVAELRTSGNRLPEDTIWVEIKGGNHAQFGWYGEQSGDGEATISREAQQEKIRQSTVEFLANFD